MSPHLRSTHLRTRASAARTKADTSTTRKTASMTKSGLTSPAYRVRKRIDEGISLGNEMVSILIGESKTKFTVHKALLHNVSPFFRAAVNWPGYDGIVYLEYENPDLFNIFTQFAYFGKFFTQGNDDVTQINSGCSSEGGLRISYDKEWSTLTDLYLLGDRLQAGSFKDAVVDAIIEKAGEDACLPVDQAPTIYNNTTPGSKLRKLIVDFHVHGFKGETLRSGSDTSPDAEAPKEFLQEVLNAFMAAGGDLYGKKKALPWVDNPCAYHDHQAGCCTR